jgi:hypothetical protein
MISSSYAQNIYQQWVFGLIQCVFGLRAQDAALGTGCGQQMNALKSLFFLLR